MIRAITQYGASHAKIRVMEGRLLKAADYRALMNKQSVREATAFLKQETCYADVLADINEYDIHRDELESLLNLDFLRDIQKIYLFENGTNRAFYKYVFMRYEIELLKRMLRTIDAGHAVADEMLIPPFLKDHISIDVDGLQGASSIREFMEKLRGTRYERVMAPLLHMTEHQNLFSVEMTLDLYYFEQVTRMRDALKDKQDRRLLQISMGSEADLLNILWIYRCKKYYSIPKEIIYAFVIPNGYRLKQADIRAMVDAPNEQALTAIIAQSPYRAAFDKGAGRFYEHSYDNYVYWMHKKLSQQHPFSILSVISYAHLKQMEIKNITSIVESIRYGLSPLEMEEFVIGLPAGGEI